MAAGRPTHGTATKQRRNISIDPYLNQALKKRNISLSWMIEHSLPILLEDPTFTREYTLLKKRLSLVEKRDSLRYEVDRLEAEIGILEDRIKMIDETSMGELGYVLEDYLHADDYTGRHIEQEVEAIRDDLVAYLMNGFEAKRRNSWGWTPTLDDVVETWHVGVYKRFGLDRWRFKRVVSELFDEGVFGGVVLEETI